VSSVANFIGTHIFADPRIIFLLSDRLQISNILAALSPVPVIPQVDIHPGFYLARIPDMDVKINNRHL
jgi:hypothetical protein